MSKTKPEWRPPAGTQTIPAPAPGSGGKDLADAKTIKADEADLAVIDSEGVLAAGETFEEGTIIGERYVIERHISSGSFGAVYKARDASIENHTIALKMLLAPSSTEAARQNALRELQLIASVSHPSVVQFKDYGWLGETLWFTMPWYDGLTLQERVDNEATLSRVDANAIFERLAHGLAAMHEVGVFHHDIKPENIFLASVSGFDEGLPVLLDLGIASKRGERPEGFTARYVPPETAAAALGEDHEIGAAADVFSLALSLRNSLEPSTAPKFTGNQVGFLHHRATVPIDPPKGREFRYLSSSFKRWLAIDPKSRPTAEAFADEIKILTLPEKRRRSRIQLAKRLTPVIVLAALLVTGLLFQLTRAEELLTQKDQRLNATNQQLTQKQQEAAALASMTQEQRQRIAEEAARAAQSEQAAKKLDRQLAKKARAQNRLTLALDELQVVHLDLLNQHDALSAEVEGLRAENNTIRSQQQTLVAQNAQLRANYDSVASQNARLQTAVNVAKQEQQRLAGENNQLRADLNSSKQRVAELTNENREIRERSKQIAAQNKQLTGENNKMKNDIKRLEKRIAALERRIEALTSGGTTVPKKERVAPKQ